MTQARTMSARAGAWSSGRRRTVTLAIVLAVAALAGSCTSSKSKDDAAQDDAVEDVAEAAAPASSSLASIVIESTDGSAFAGSRTTFVLTDQDGGSRLVAVEATVAGTATTVALEPGTYRIAPSAEVQVSPTASFAVRDLSETKVVVPQAAEGADVSAPVARVQFGLDVERSPFDLGMDELSSTSATLSWRVLDGATVASYQARLTESTEPATGRDDGTEIALSSPTATSVVIPGLGAGREYTVTLFATDRGGEELAFRSISLTTPPADGSEPAFVLAPNTIVPTDFDDLDPKLLDDGTVSVTLGSSREQRSTTAIPGVQADDLAGGCVVGTPLLVSSEVAGDDAFYGLIASCEEQPSGWRGQQGGEDLEDVVARVDTGVPLAAIVPYLSFHSTGHERCVVTAGAAGPDDADPCAAADADGDGISDTTESALGLDPNDPGDDWDSRVASGGPATPGAGTPALPAGELQAPADLATGPLQVTVLWATGDDLDLTVTDPDGKLVAGQTPTTSGGRMDRTDEGDPSCRSTSTRAESAVWSAAPPEGTYAIQVTNFAGTADAPRPACGSRLQARLQISVSDVMAVDRVVTVGAGCPTTIEVVDGTVQDAGFIASACSSDGTRWRMVSGLADTNGDGQASKGDTVRFFEYPKTFDGTEYEQIPMEDCVVVEFEAAFTGPPDLRVRGTTCSVYFRSERDPGVKLHQERFGADSRRAAGNRPGPGDFDLDLWDIIREPKSNTSDRIEDTGSEELVEQLSVRDDPFLRVDIDFVPAPPSGWRGATERPAIATAGSTVLGLPEVVCEAEGKATISPRFGLDTFHDVAITLKKTKLTWDVDAGVTAHVDPLIAVDGSYQCGLDIDGVSVQLTTVPIPINLEIAPSLTAGVEGSVEVSGPKLELTLGVDTDGYVDASIEACETLWFLPDVPCGVDFDTEFNATPIARFAHGGITGSLQGDAKLGAGVEATIGVGTKSTFLTAKAGFALTFEPLVGTVSASGEVTLVPGGSPDAPADEPADEPPAGSSTYRGSDPPTSALELDRLQADTSAHPRIVGPDGTGILGPTTAGTCFDSFTPRTTTVNFAGQLFPLSECPDARCVDPGNDRPVFTAESGCAQARCYLGGAIVDASNSIGLPRCPLLRAPAVTPEPAAPPPADDPVEEAEPGSGAAPTFCADASIGATLKVAFAAEFWVLGFGEEKEYPIFGQDVPYPGAQFELGDCEG